MAFETCQYLPLKPVLEMIVLEDTAFGQEPACILLIAQEVTAL